MHVHVGNILLQQLIICIIIQVPKLESAVDFHVFLLLLLHMEPLRILNDISQDQYLENGSAIKLSSHFKSVISLKHPQLFYKRFMLNKIY